MSEQLLLDDRLAPITSELGFVQTPVETVAEALVDWQESIHGPRGASYTTGNVSGDLEALLQTLLPLTTTNAVASCSCRRHRPSGRRTSTTGCRAATCSPT